MINKKIRAIITLPLLFSASSFSSEITEAIYNGVSSSLKDVPYQAQLTMVRSDGNIQSSGICGAVIIDNSVALTAAHCVDTSEGLDTDHVSIKFLSYLDKETASEITVNVGSEYIKYHPDWTDSVNDSNDIAVIYYPDIFEKARKVKVASSSEATAMFTEFGNSYVSGQDNKSNVLASGYGLDSNGTLGQLNRVLLTGMPSERCALIKPSEITGNDIICVKSPSVSSNYSICSGDSGGPLAWTNPSYSSDADYGVRLVGITSFVTQDTTTKECLMNESNYAGFTNIDYYKSFINSAVDELSGTTGYDIDNINVEYTFDTNPFILSGDESNPDNSDDEDKSGSATKGQATGGSFGLFSTMLLLIAGLIRRERHTGVKRSH